MYIFKKYSYIKFNEDPWSGSRVVLLGRTDRHDRPNSRSSQFLQTPLLKAAHYLQPWGNYLMKWLEPEGAEPKISYRFSCAVWPASWHLLASYERSVQTWCIVEVSGLFGCDAVSLGPETSRPWKMTTTFLRNLWKESGDSVTVRRTSGPCAVCTQYCTLSVLNQMVTGVITDIIKTFLGALAKFLKATVSFVMSVCLSVRVEQLGCHWTGFHEIWFFGIVHSPTDALFIKLGKV